ncbi:MAG: hypothetical protein IBJ19_03610 [Gemmatimonadaceae bacterium]|nr:hypothetical protein [Gemmatimonadaceae bacterium]
MTAPPATVRKRRIPVWLFRPLPAELGWPPYLWLLYVVPFVVWPLLARANPKELLLSGMLFLVFLWSYFQAYWAPYHQRLWHVGLQGLVGLAMLPWNAGAVVFFVFAAAVAGRLESERLAWRVILLVGFVGALWAWAVDANMFTVLPVAIMSPLIGAVTLHQERERRAVTALQLATARNRELAATAERERIAHDLHDALGHTLSLVVLKSQVAQRLAKAVAGADRSDAPSASQQDLLRELSELETAARSALQDVRRAIRGYRATLDEAVLASRSLLEAAGIACEVQITLTAPDSLRDAVLAAVLRELCTNVARHAAAQRCRITIHESPHFTVLEVSDDGRGGATPGERARGHMSEGGEGLRGVAERIQAVGGQLQIADATARDGWPHGTTVTVTLPREQRVEPVTEQVA